jgi:hypothetical protein
MTDKELIQRYEQALREIKSLDIEFHIFAATTMQRIAEQALKEASDDDQR